MKFLIFYILFSIFSSSCMTQKNIPSKDKILEFNLFPPKVLFNNYRYEIIETQEEYVHRINSLVQQPLRRYL